MGRRNKHQQVPTDFQKIKSQTNKNDEKMGGNKMKRVEKERTYMTLTATATTRLLFNAASTIDFYFCFVLCNNSGSHSGDKGHKPGQLSKCA